MKKILGARIALNLTFAVLLIGGIVYALGFGICLYIARGEVNAEVSKKVERDMSYMQCFVDGQLQRVEDVSYTFLSTKFGATHRDSKGNAYVVIDHANFVIPSEEEVYVLLEELLETNPHICGAAIGFEKFLYTDTKGQYGFAAYVTNLSGTNKRLHLGEIHDYHEKEWYRVASTTDEPYWSVPFRETSTGEVVTCFSVPLHGIGGRLIGVLALDINTNSFREECTKIAPFEGAEVTIVDKNFCFVSHPDTTLLLRKISEVNKYASYRADDSMKIKMKNQESGHYTVNEGSMDEALFYFCPVPRTHWTIAIECPKKSIYQGVDRMKRDTTMIALVSLAIMVVSFIWIFRRIQKETLGKASMENELRVASGVQMSMVPMVYPAFPDTPELDVYGFIKPAKSVGGDLYDYFIRDGRLFFCIGDVSGKGIPASLFMMVNLALFRSQAQSTFDPSEILQNINNSISRNNTHCMFCTLFVGVLDISTGKLDYCNGGHNAPIIRHILDDGTISAGYMSPRSNIAVGMFDGFEYVSETTVLKPGEAIFLYTDGVTEAENPSHQLFGEEKTLKALKDARTYTDCSSKSFVDHMVKCVENHANGAEQSDDITMVIVEYRNK